MLTEFDSNAASYNPIFVREKKQLKHGSDLVQSVEGNKSKGDNST